MEEVTRGPRLVVILSAAVDKAANLRRQFLRALYHLRLRGDDAPTRFNCLHRNLFASLRFVVRPSGGAHVLTFLLTLARNPPLQPSVALSTPMIRAASPALLTCAAGVHIRLQALIQTVFVAPRATRRSANRLATPGSLRR